MLSISGQGPIWGSGIRDGVGNVTDGVKVLLRMAVGNGVTTTVDVMFGGKDPEYWR